VGEVKGVPGHVHAGGVAQKAGRRNACCIISMVKAQSASPSHAAGMPRPLSSRSPGRENRAAASHAGPHAQRLDTALAIRRLSARAARARLDDVLARRLDDSLGPVDPPRGVGLGGGCVRGGEGLVVAAVGDGHELDPETLLDLLGVERLGRPLEGRRDEHGGLRRKSGTTRRSDAAPLKIPEIAGIEQRDAMPPQAIGGTRHQVVPADDRQVKDGRGRACWKITGMNAAQAEDARADRQHRGVGPAFSSSRAASSAFAAWPTTKLHVPEVSFSDLGQAFLSASIMA